MRSITFQQANTVDGSYDVALSLPYPVTVKLNGSATLGHGDELGAGFGTCIGFVSTLQEPDLVESLILVSRVLTQRVDPMSVVAMFPVYLDTQGIYTDVRVITKVLAIDGVLVTQEEEEEA